MCLSLMNLPREERYKPENMITAGVLPGPDEPEKTINKYLAALANELEELWKDGFKYKAKERMTKK